MKKIVILFDRTLPYKGEKPTEESLETLKQHAVIVDADNLARELETADCFINLHTPYFPKQSWQAIFAFLNTGKAMISAGGAPFKIPVRREEGKWVTEVEQLGYHQQLNIHETPLVDPRESKLKANDDFSLLTNKEHLFDVTSSCSLTLHVTKDQDIPHENGSGGPMDAHIYPLLKAVTSKGRDVAAPVVLLENTKGRFTGGRWMFVNQELTSTFWINGGAAELIEWANFCAEGVTEIWVKTNYASYYPGEQPQLLLQFQSLLQEKSECEWTCSVQIKQENEEPIWQEQWRCNVSEEIHYEQVLVPIDVKPGFYQVICEVTTDDNEKRILRHGFWGYDEELLKEGSPLACNKDYFEKDGRPFPVVGMTYMTSDVARKFLFLPNASAWDKDMSHMKKAGINLLRTGLWTGWRNVMFVDGHPYEEVMRAIDAFILTAKKHSLELTFNFFSFTPELWEGQNPYLDPRSVSAQKRFIAAIVSRHKETTNIQWDLINEPSMFDPKRIFSGAQTSGDLFEKQAFQKWLKQRHKDIQVLQEHWNMTPDELADFKEIALPEKEEINFSTTDKHSKKGNRWLDYSLFSMDMHNQWARELSKTIKKLAPHQLVTVGQDEALGGKRPSPFFYGEAVDYTTVHSWWLLDHLLWDSVFTKVISKPNLVQETGIMHVERPDGSSKRTEKETKSILERKYAYAFATGGAGAVQWLWNTNHYMDNINESNIGAIRSDQTEKLEADVSYDFGEFISQSSDLFQERVLEEVVVVYPFSNDFSNRDFAFSATAKAARLLHYDLRTPIRGISEYHLDDLKEAPPKLIIVPSPHNFKTEAYEKLVDFVEEYGGTILWTGPLNLDEYWRFRPRAQLWGETSPKNILREERLLVDNQSHSVLFLSDQQASVTFGKNRLGELEKEVLLSSKESQGTELLTKVVGKGEIVWCPIPVELNNRDEPVLALYKKVLDIADVESGLEWLVGAESLGIYGRMLSFKKGKLFVFVSEDAHDREVKVKDPSNGKVYQFLLESDRSIMFSTDDAGEIEVVYRPSEVMIKVDESD